MSYITRTGNLAETPTLREGDNGPYTYARVLVSANYQGTQFSADLTFTQDGCTAEYHVVGVYPVASCEADKDCQDTSVTAINPDFDLRCEKDLGLCVLKDEPPALN